MENWRMELIGGGKSLTEVKIPKGIFQGDALSSLIFVIAMVTITYLGNAQADTKLQIVRKISHLMYTENIKLFAKNEKELEILILAVRI